MCGSARRISYSGVSGNPLYFCPTRAEINPDRDRTYLSVQLQDQSEHTMCSRMLGTKVDYPAQLDSYTDRSVAKQNLPVKCLILASFLLVPSRKISSALIPCSLKLISSLLLLEPKLRSEPTPQPNLERTDCRSRSGDCPRSPRLFVLGRHAAW